MRWDSRFTPLVCRVDRIDVTTEMILYFYFWLYRNYFYLFPKESYDLSQSLAKDPPMRIRTKRDIAAKIPSGSIAVIFRLSVATVAGNIRAVDRYQTPVWPTGYIVVIWHRGKHTRLYTYIHTTRPPASILHTLHPSHTRIRCAYTWNSECLPLSGSVGAWPSATYWALPRFPFSWSHEGKTRLY